MRLLKIATILILLGITTTIYGEESLVHIEKGDTLYQISKEYKVSIDFLLKYNGIENANTIKIGQEIKIPHSYKVKRGDTLYGIAREAGISFDELCKINGLDKNHLLKLNEVILLPSKETIPEPQETAVPEPVIVFEDKSGIDYFWPHAGVRVSMSGKLKGEEILGEKGDEIVSVSTGKVVWVAPYRGYGKLIMIETASHHIYAYGGNEETFVKVGDNVFPGTSLGLMGINSIEKNAKAFFFVYKDGKPVETAKAPRG
jgi:lipoprotein NlpD